MLRGTEGKWNRKPNARPDLSPMGDKLGGGREICSEVVHGNWKKTVGTRVGFLMGAQNLVRKRKSISLVYQSVREAEHGVRGGEGRQIRTGNESSSVQEPNEGLLCQSGALNPVRGELEESTQLLKEALPIAVTVDEKASIIWGKRKGEGHRIPGGWGYDLGGPRNAMIRVQ